jgi:eukaryotic-like serine/threonine-protein kinase
VPVTTQQGTGSPGTAPRLLNNRYAVLGELGRGGMGVVWRAEDRVIGRQVAVKEVRLPSGVAPAERAVFQERVLREARSAGRLNDPAVITVYDVLHEGDATFIVMELVPAPTLSELVRSAGPLPPDRVADLARQALAALETAHAAGIVHRDVKPSNLMVLPNGRIKLADFGIAQAVDDPRLTSSGALIGSPGYLAPERLHGGGASPATDLWALGATLYFAVQGQSPFERSSTAATLHAVLTEVPPLTRCAGPLASAITGLLIADPATRLTAPQVRALLSMPTSTTATVPAAGPGLPPTVRSGVAAGRRGRLGVWPALGLAVLLGAGGLIGGYAWGDRSATPVPPAGLGPALSYGTGGDLPVWGLNAGSCGNGSLTAGRRFPSSNTVSCTDPHDFEVFAYGTGIPTDKDAAYPGLSDLAGAASTWCGEVFRSDVVTARDKATALGYQAVVPSAGTWQVRTDDSSYDHSRYQYCVLYNRDHSQLTTDAVEGD